MKFDDYSKHTVTINECNTLNISTIKSNKKLKFQFQALACGTVRPQMSPTNPFLTTSNILITTSLPSHSDIFLSHPILQTCRLRHRHSHIHRIIHSIYLTCNRVQCFYLKTRKPPQCDDTEWHSTRNNRKTEKNRLCRKWQKNHDPTTKHRFKVNIFFV